MVPEPFWWVGVLLCMERRGRLKMTRPNLVEIIGAKASAPLVIDGLIEAVLGIGDKEVKIQALVSRDLEVD